MPRALALAALLGSVAGSAAAGLVVAVALDHDPQGEYADPATGAWTSDLFVLAGAWFAIGFAPVFGATAVLVGRRRPVQAERR